MKNKQLTRTSLFLVVALAFALSPFTLTGAQAGRIAAVVNGAVITDLDVSQRQKLERLLSGGKRRLGKSAALNALIDDKLKLLEARDRNRTPSDAEVNRAIGNMARNAKLSEKRMFGIFRQAGVTKDTLKSWLKAQLAWRGLIRSRFNAQVRVGEAEIMQALAKKSDNKSKVESTIEFDLMRVVFIARKNAPKAERNQKLREAKRFRSNFSSCTKDMESARRLKDVAVTRIGRRLSTNLHPTLKKSLRETAVNRLTAPMKVDSGYEMLAVCGKKDLGKQATLRDEMEVKLKDERSKALSRKYLGELRSRAVVEKR